MQQLVSPVTAIKVGDHIPDLSSDGPAVVTVGSITADKNGEQVIPIHVEGEDDPRPYPADSEILIAREVA